MKIFFFLLFLLFSQISFSQSLSIPEPGSIQDRLDDIEQQQRRMKREQIQERMSDNLYRNNQSNNSNLFLRDFRDNLRFYYLVTANNKLNLYIDLRNIRKLPTTDTVLFSEITELKQPLYDDSKPYFYTKSRSFVNCKKNTITKMNLETYDITGYQIKDIVLGDGDRIISPNSSDEKIKKYLCR